MGIQAPAEVKFRLIQEAISQDNNVLSVSNLCRIAGVSRSGYYAGLDATPAREKRENQDQADFQLILEAYRFRGYAKGVRSIHMRFLYQNIIMSIKKIRRLMEKYQLFCPIRKANPYRSMAKALATSHVAPNLVKQEFKREPRKILLTYITYLFYMNEKCCLSTILDTFTHEVLAYRVSLKVGFVLETVERLIAEHGSMLDNETIVHSDQGCHYTSYAFIQRLKDEKFVQSMSRRGNCWDNAPQESFFGHMKDEIQDEIANCFTFDAVLDRIDDWMDCYNNDRYQWDLMKLSPAECFRSLQTGVYPLPIYDSGAK